MMRSQSFIMTLRISSYRVVFGFYFFVDHDDVGGFPGCWEVRDLQVSVETIPFNFEVGVPSSLQLATDATFFFDEVNDESKKSGPVAM